jgi:hypothetical protein
MAKKKGFRIKIDTMELVLNRAGKAHKGMPEVNRGCGVHIPKKHKKKHKDAWKREVKKYLG